MPTLTGLLGLNSKLPATCSSLVARVIVVLLDQSFKKTPKPTLASVKDSDTLVPLAALLTLLVLF